MNQIKAIETMYKGYRFRSRLEARWAVFFDTLGIEWKYEDQGFEKEIFVDGRTETIRYLPDFFLPHPRPDANGGIYVEVKGDKFALQKEQQKYTNLLDFGSALPHFDNSGNTGAYDPVRGLLLLSDIPQATQMKVYFHPIIQHHKGLVRKWAFFSPGIVEVEGGSMLSQLLGLNPDWNMSGADWIIETRDVAVKAYFPKVYDAYAAARSARFEHGEKG